MKQLLKFIILISFLIASLNSFSDEAKSRYSQKIQFVLPQTYENVSHFSEGLASVKINHKWGFIDKRGKIVIEPQFNLWQAQFNSYFSDGLAAVNFNNGKDEKFNIDANNVTNVKWGFINKRGELVIPPKFMGTYSSPPVFKEELASVMATSMFPNSELLLDVSAKYGYIDKRGEYIIEPIYDKAFSFNNGLAIVQINDKSGFINKKGEVVIPLIYDAINDFSDGVAVVSMNGNYFYIDRNGNRVTDKNFEYLNSFSEGLAKFSENGKSGFINLNSEVVIKPFLTAESMLAMLSNNSFNDGLCLVEFGFSENYKNMDSGKFGYINKKGKVVINPKFDSAQAFKNGKAIVDLDNKHFFINKKGERISPLYDELSFEADGLVKYGVGDYFNRKYGFISY